MLRRRFSRHVLSPWQSVTPLGARARHDQGCVRYGSSSLTRRHLLGRRAIQVASLKASIESRDEEIAKPVSEAAGLREELVAKERAVAAAEKAARESAAEVRVLRRWL